jgi:ribose 5-phosphate isomerase B
MKIAIGSDHAGYEYKEQIKEYLNSQYEVIDCGTHMPKSCDYPDFAKEVSTSVSNGESDFGILICGTGIGMSISSNKINGCRAALCAEPVSAKLSRKHNNANVLCFGARIIGIEMAKEITSIFLNTDFEGGRHEKRVKKFMEFENEKA